MRLKLAEQRQCGARSAVIFGSPRSDVTAKVLSLAPVKERRAAAADASPAALQLRLACRAVCAHLAVWAKSRGARLYPAKRRPPTRQHVRASPARPGQHQHERRRRNSHPQRRCRPSGALAEDGAGASAPTCRQGHGRGALVPGQPPRPEPADRTLPRPTFVDTWPFSPRAFPRVQHAGT